MRDGVCASGKMRTAQPIPDRPYPPLATFSETSMSTFCSFCIVCVTTNSVRRSWLSGCSSQSTFHSSDLPTYHSSIHPTPHTHPLSFFCPAALRKRKGRTNTSRQDRTRSVWGEGGGGEGGGACGWRLALHFSTQPCPGGEGEGGYSVRVLTLAGIRGCGICLSSREREKERADGAVGTNKAMLIAHTSVPFHARTREERREIGGEGREGTREGVAKKHNRYLLFIFCFFSATMKKK